MWRAAGLRGDNGSGEFKWQAQIPLATSDTSNDEIRIQRAGIKFKQESDDRRAVERLWKILMQGCLV
ncbi:hypothetical protein N7466_008384 [Penicillium verhagenii]|uniref:uncharacterized protein n=1 Tax=Penicillium verhagenii TaxID=1562060 RepID=UPI002544F266|nr:uncharacterized protein N7466_008384 [Penicillium verhagenii]KAJ5924197.1 hypothetical protein N7466_008384 [Penicillium verhagenii]